MSDVKHASEPQVLYLQQVLELVERGELLIPAFQRPIRWTDDQRMRLLESITRGLPIGSLMVWRTSQEIRRREQIGDVPLPEPAKGDHQYLIDGFQRISTLYVALLKDAAQGPDKDGHRWALGYNLRKREWVFLDSITDEERAVTVPGHLFFKSVELLRFQRRFDGPDADALTELSDELASRLRNYKLAVTPLTTNDVSLAAETLGVINTQGTRMSDLDLLDAWTFRDGSTTGFSDQIEECRERLRPAGWGELDERALLMALRLQLGLDAYTKDSQRVGDALNRHPEALKEVTDLLLRAAELLNRRCGVVSGRVVPYVAHLILLADALRDAPTPSAEVEDALTRWFWWTTSWMSFAGISGYRMKEMVTYLRALARGEEQTWPLPMGGGKQPHPLPATADPRTARTRGLALHMLRDRGHPANLKDRLAADGAKALIRALHDLPSPDARSHGNLLLVAPGEETELIRAISDWRFGQLTLHPLHQDPAVRDQHLISEEAWAHLRHDDVKTFIKLRTTRMNKLEADFLNDLGLPVGVP
jgi:hypothetical protein